MPVRKVPTTEPFVNGFDYVESIRPAAAVVPVHKADQLDSIASMKKPIGVISNNQKGVRHSDLYCDSGADLLDELVAYDTYADKIPAQAKTDTLASVKDSLASATSSVDTISSAKDDDYASYTSYSKRSVFHSKSLYEIDPQDREMALEKEIYLRTKLQQDLHKASRDISVSLATDAQQQLKKLQQEEYNVQDDLRAAESKHQTASTVNTISTVAVFATFAIGLLGIFTGGVALVIGVIQAVGMIAQGVSQAFKTNFSATMSLLKGRLAVQKEVVSMRHDKVRTETKNSKEANNQDLNMFKALRANEDAKHEAIQDLYS